MPAPLSLIAGLVGLTAASLEITTSLCKLRDALKSASTLLTTTEIEVRVVSATLKLVERYFVREMEARNLEMIPIESFTALIADCVQTFSALQSTIDQISSRKPSMRSRDQARSLLKEKEFQHAIERMQRQKLSLNLLLGTMRCVNIQHAVRAANNYQLTIELSLTQNQWLSRRMTEGATDASPNNTIPPVLHLNDGLEDHFLAPGKRDTTRQSGISILFEDVLPRSRVYSKPQLPNRLTNTFSATSCHSLADVSDLSILDLPIFASDLSNSKCYQFTSRNSVARLHKELPNQKNRYTIRRLRTLLSEHREAIEQSQRKADEKETGIVPGMPGFFGGPLPLH